jgi:hypothetical protein
MKVHDILRIRIEFMGLLLYANTPLPHSGDEDASWSSRDFTDSSRDFTDAHACTTPVPNPITVRTRTNDAIQKVPHCCGFLRSTHIWTQVPGGALYISSYTSSNRSLQKKNSSKFGLDGPSNGASESKFCPCSRRRLCVSGSHCGKRRLRLVIVSVKRAFGNILCSLLSDVSPDHNDCSLIEWVRIPFSMLSSHGIVQMANEEVLEREHRK